MGTNSYVYKSYRGKTGRGNLPPTGIGLRYLIFCPDVIGHVGLIAFKLRLISELMTSLTGKRIITIYILPNISRSKGNQATKFGQLIKYNVRNIFLDKP